jgi:hypothetical protein
MCHARRAEVRWGSVADFKLPNCHHLKMPPAKHSESYLKFLHLAHALRQTPSLPTLDAVEERLLNVFAAAWHAGRQISTTEAARMVPDASERTVYRRLKTLSEKGLVTFGTDPGDQRLRYVMPTRQTDQYFEKLGQCMEQAQGA